MPIGLNNDLHHCTHTFFNLALWFIEIDGMDYRMFYAELGKLLYAVADADGIVSPQERKNMFELIQTRLMHKETHTDEFGTNDAWYAAFEFEVADEQIMSAADAFLSFTEYIEENKNKLDEDTRQLCLILADRLADSYRHTNKKENALIQKLREVLFSLENQPSITKTGM
jgi:uncharacterized tellurite resistance protein B-like protein